MEGIIVVVIASMISGCGGGGDGCSISDDCGGGDVFGLFSSIDCCGGDGER